MRRADEVVRLARAEIAEARRDPLDGPRRLSRLHVRLLALLGDVERARAGKPERDVLAEIHALGIIRTYGIVLVVLALLPACASGGGLEMRVGRPEAREEALSELRRVAGIWDAALAREGLSCRLSHVLERTRIVLVERDQVAGRFIPPSRGIFGTGILSTPPTVRVVARVPASESALGHELGHVALWHCGLPHDQPHCGLAGSPPDCKREDDVLWIFHERHGVPW